MTLDDILDVCVNAQPSDEQLDAFCAHSGRTRASALDAIAQDVAHRYMIGSLTYNLGDAAMNHLFAYGSRRGMLPEIMESVFLAFDEGEYVHSGDSPEITPDTRTRPKIAEILAKLGAT